METNVIADPHAVVIEFVSAAVAPRAVLRVAEDVGVTYTAVERELGLVEDYLRIGILHGQALSIRMFKDSGRVCWVALRYYDSRNHHAEVSDRVNCSENQRFCGVLAAIVGKSQKNGQSGETKEDESCDGPGE